MTYYRDARSIIEGICPTHGTPLERIDDYGWCEACGLGHSYTVDAEGIPIWNVHLIPRIPPVFVAGGET